MLKSTSLAVSKKYNIKMEKKQRPVREKHRNNEKRKEKSRDAARSRRSRETEIFTDLANTLPIEKDQISQLDKASVMRLAIAYLRVREMVCLFPKIEVIKDGFISDESIFLKSLEGFLLILSPDGEFIYLSENVTQYIGITQLELMGQNIYEYSHPCDHDEIKDVLACRSNEKSMLSKSFFIRLKCTITNKGRVVNLKSAAYKVIHCRGHMVNNAKSNSETTTATTKLTKSQKAKNEKDKIKVQTMQRCLVAVGQPIPHPSNIEAPLGRDTFLSKHSLDMKFTYADDIMADFLGYTSEDLIGKSLYDYHHARDSDAIFAAFKCLFSKGQCETNRYRFLAKSGGYVWVLTQATVINDKMQKPQSVVCVNYVISAVECKDIIYSSLQIAESTEVADKDTNNNSDCEESSTTEDEVAIKEEVKLNSSKEELPTTVKELEQSTPVIISARPRTATSRIFGPRTKEMSKGYLMFSDEEPGLTMLKDEPEDLTHLAPQAGDVDVPLVIGEVCVPLEEHPFLSDVLDDFLFKDNFNPLLTDEPSDPFISYRDSCDPSPQLLSPNISKNSDSSLPSLNSPGGSLGDDDQMSTFMSLQMDDDPDLLMKAPYIPMNMGDDLPLLMSDDVIWNTNNNDKISTNKGPDVNSSLAQLLCSNANQSKINDHGGGIIHDDSVSDIYNSSGKCKSVKWNLSSTKSQKGRSNKRTNSGSYDISNKRVKSESKGKMSSELLQQLMSNNTQRGHSRGRSNWLLDSGQKATCVSQPSESVLMNLLDSIGNTTSLKTNKLAKNCPRPPDPTIKTFNMLRKNSFSLLDPDATSLASFLDLTQQDYEVNAPANNLLLQGEDLLTALEMNAPI